MTLRSFLYACRATMAEESLAFTAETEAAAAPLPSPADIRAQNAQSMAMLQGMMKGVQGAPAVKR